MSNKVARLLRWARITKAGSDDQQFATQQMTSMGKVADGLIVFPYGVHGNVPPDALALMFAVQGNPDNRAAIAWTPKDRPLLKAGEVAYYHPPTGTIIKFDEDGNISIATGNDATGDITVDAKDLTINASGDVSVTAGGDIEATAGGELNATATTSVSVTAPLITLNGNVVINGTFTSNSSGGSGEINFTSTSVKHNGKEIGENHGHTQGNDSDGDTEAAISGVT